VGISSSSVCELYGPSTKYPTELIERLCAVSGGFATVQPGSVLSINAVEGYPLEDFSAENVRNQISEAQKIAGGSGSEQDKAEANIELEVSTRLCLKLCLRTDVM